MTTDPIRLMLVDDHDIVRTGLKSFLDTQVGIQVVAEAESGESALELLLTVSPDVVLMDLTLPGMSGMDATRKIKAHNPACKVLALTVHADQQYFFEMLAAGADGYVTKQSAAEELLEAIHAAAAGLVYLQPALAAWLLKDYRDLLARFPPHLTASATSSADRLSLLSQRELQVLESVARGKTSVQIARELGLSPKTVARHRERIMNKLDLHSSAGLVQFAIRYGLIDLG